MAFDAESHLESAPSGVSRQNDKLYTAEGILDPRKRRAQKKQRKANKLNRLNEMDADYDFKVDYRMKDLGSDGEINSAEEGNADSDDEADRTVPMAGVELDA